MYKTKILPFVMLLIAVIGTANAYDLSIYGFEWKNTCINNTALLRTADVYVNGSLLSFNQTIDCVTGCSNSTLNCKPDSMSMNIWIVAVAFLVFGMIVAGVKLPFLVGLPLLMVSIIFTAYFLTMSDFFSASYQILLAVFILLEVLTMFYVIQEYRGE